MRRTTTIRAFGAATASLFAVATALGAATPPLDIMHGIFERFSQLLPLVLDDERFLEDETQAEITRLLGELVEASDQLEGHAEGRDADFRYHADSLAGELTEAYRRQQDSRPEEARFFVVTTTQSCISCHTRLPKARDYPLADKLTHSSAIESLEADERALFQIATRSFGEALTSFEQFLLDPATDVRRVTMSDALDHYLTTAIRVERDMPRARNFLRRLAKRPGTSEPFRETLAGWTADLDGYAPSLAAVPDLASARAIIEKPSETGPRAALVRDLVASSLLLRLIDGESADEATRAEAYYWLGVAGDRHAIALWRPETATHFERAIRLAPAAEHSELALDRLRSHWTFMYGGSGGTHLPRSAAETLEELEQIIEEAAKSKALPPK